VARNEAARFAARRPRHISVEASQEPATKETHDQLAAQETAHIVERRMAALEPALREIVDLKIFGGLTFAQIATALDLPPGTVATRYRRALQILRQQLKREMS
jgi:RNA polymerase sigma-70 factor, ECF subfamily